MNPVAVNASGQILLRFLCEFNESGGASIERNKVRFGWLIVSAQGLWEEHKHASIVPINADPEEAGRILWKDYNRYVKEFEAPFNWAHAPKSVQPILEAYQFTQNCSVDPKLGKGTVKWTPKGLYKGDTLVARGVRQMTLGKKKSLRGLGSNIRATFFAEGVALFRNKRHYEEGDAGAMFHFPNYLGNMDIGFDESQVDGLCFLETAALEQ